MSMIVCFDARAPVRLLPGILGSSRPGNPELTMWLFTPHYITHGLRYKSIKSGTKLPLLIIKFQYYPF